MRRWTFFVVLALLSLVAGEAGAQAQKSVALVIGNSAYERAPALANPISDATAVATMLRNTGFVVVDMHNVGSRDMLRALRNFAEIARGADIAVVSFAGHGMEVQGTNFLIPTDARLESDADIEEEAVSLLRIEKALAEATRLRLIILDACRDNPFEKTMKRTLATRALSRGLAEVKPGSDTLIAFAAKAGPTALDGTGSHSPFTEALLKHIAVPGLDVRFAFGRVRDEVRQATANRQDPFLYGSLGGKNVPLVPGQDDNVENAAAAARPGDLTLDAPRDYELAKAAGTKEVWDAFLLKHSGTPFYGALGRTERAKLLDAARPPADVGQPPKANAPAAPAPSVAAIEPATRTRTLDPGETVKRAPSAEKKKRAEEPKAPRRASVKTWCQRAVRAGTRWGLDNGVGIIAYARSQCGG
jgi:hypothetical protein